MFLYDCLSGQLRKLCVCVLASTQAGMGVEAKRRFCVWLSFMGAGRRMGREEKRRLGLGERERVSQLGGIKVGLTFSAPSIPAELPPVPSHPLFSSSFPPHGKSGSLGSRGYCLRRQ